MTRIGGAEVGTVVVVNDHAHVVGGASQVALASAEALARAGLRVVLFAAVGPVMESLRTAGVEVMCLDQFDILSDPSRARGAVQGIWNRQANASMHAVLATADTADTIVHVHSWTKALSSSVVRAAIDAKFKVVLTLHDYFTACPNGAMFDYGEKAVCARKPLSLDCIAADCDSRSYSHKLWRVARQFVQRRAGRVPDSINTFIGVSRFSADILRQFLAPDAKLHYIGNPINVERREPTDVETNCGFVYVGRLAPEKGVERLAAAATVLNCPITFVGDGELRGKISSICPHAEITGWVSGNEVLQRIASSRALVLPSLWYETQGLVVAEAAALGVPAIVAEDCAARDMVIDGETGLLFKGRDDTDLAKKLAAIGAPGEARRLGRLAYEAYWKAPQTIDKHVSELQSCYRWILNDQ